MKKITDSVYFESRGRDQGKLKGEWPSFAYAPRIQPSVDPINFFRTIRDSENPEDTERDKLHDFERAGFATPDLMVWDPETRWPYLYPEGRPFCPFHSTSMYVKAYDDTGMLGSLHLCIYLQTRQDENKFVGEKSPKATDFPVRSFNSLSGAIVSGSSSYRSFCNG
jgi:hypothetical protein